VHQRRVQEDCRSALRRFHRQGLTRVAVGIPGAATITTATSKGYIVQECSSASQITSASRTPSKALEGWWRRLQIKADDMYPKIASTRNPRPRQDMRTPFSPVKKGPRESKLPQQIRHSAQNIAPQHPRADAVLPALPLAGCSSRVI
jgi:hypothetical protein